MLTLPPSLLSRVQKLSHARTKSEAVVIALEEYVKDRKLNRLMDRMGKGFGTSLHELKVGRKRG
ncbi:MAG: hypothetical protein A3I05_04280 [Deltaproteobacteria bacterium RIFCSPLOWO2_02_FULL_44_10]|nr:MAG: hypothetical protein A3I05_04280 [Deltaproteobacteria bacterium RIFCSPLOWO2_02_FULL_44_10]